MSFKMKQHQIDVIVKAFRDNGLENLTHTLSRADLSFRWRVLNLPTNFPQWKPSFIRDFPFLIGLELPDLPEEILNTMRYNSAIVSTDGEMINVARPDALPTDIVTRLSNYEYDERMFIPINSDPVLDSFWSNRGGVMPATVNMVEGGPGAGKTTVLTHMLSTIQNIQPDRKVLYISSEMTEIDFYDYIERMPGIKDIDSLFLLNFTDYNILALLEAEFAKGYDVIVFDSFTEALEMIKDTVGVTTKIAESELLKLMIKQTKGQNERKAFTAFINILQLTKGGTFVGSNKLKHLTTAMLQMTSDKETGERYMMFTKNRRGKVLHKLYYTLNSTGVTYQGARLEQERIAQEALEKNKLSFEQNTKSFDELFSAPEEESETVSRGQAIYDGEDESDYED